ncbi:MAG: bifunctional 5,10-methylenetetrahydrofolate dehydrogenase/5,10-methenyltetrahydrofolate cyclohydrolase [Planctomycetes bacterium]|nr:bifunctional 5,10-methylenetetrahydrofolate dehydrogenase/5,10-methenyltetrahydrofolate cyclohydrolase [Planctomycetota bacterium]
MPAIKLDGNLLAKTIRAEIAEQVKTFIASGGKPPGLATVLVGDDPASHVYVRNKRKACEQAGMVSIHHALSANVTQKELLDVVASLNADPAVNGILVQLPLPKGIDEEAVIRAILPGKDVDAFHPENVGLLAAGHPRFLPCTPYGVRLLLSRNGIATAGKHVVILGRSNIVGKPLAMILMQKPTAAFPDAGDATVTVVHRGTRDLPSITRQADILIAAIGVPRFVTPEMVKPGAAVIDVGINSVDGKLVGDVHESVIDTAGAVSPVPGGVGPMTITMLLQNTLAAAKIYA